MRRRPDARLGINFGVGWPTGRCFKRTNALPAGIGMWSSQISRRARSASSETEGQPGPEAGKENAAPRRPTVRTCGPWLLLVLGGIGCSHFNALPPKLEPAEPVQYSKLEVPSNLEVISVDFEAVASNGGDDGLRSRAWLKVYGRHRQTRTLYLLIYERGTGRRDPIDVIEIASVEADTIIERRQR
jgi:hypothetical protein